MSNFTTVQYGDYIISVDIEKTKEYYSTYPVNNSQANRNFAKYCENLSAEEKDFFNSFSINPLCCEIEHIGVSKKGEFPCGGYYLICGKYLKFPQENLIPVEELETADFTDSRINTGIFQFDFQCPEYELSDIPGDIPEGFICLRFWCEDMKWLLDEEPEERMYEPPHFWELGKILKEKKHQKEWLAADTEEANRECSSLFTGLGITFRQLDRRELYKFNKAWVRFYAPPEKSFRKVKKLCLSSGKFSTYLWHIFSFKLVPCKEGADAENAYSLTQKGVCILEDNINNLAYRLENGNAITIEVLKSFEDVTVTACDFSWTYSKTHEETCGPYFYTVF